MAIHQNLKTFAGRPVRQYNPRAKSKARGPCVYRVGGRDFIKDAYDAGGHTFAELLDLFLDAHGGPELDALVLGAWDFDQMCSSQGRKGGADLVEALVANRSRVPALRHLFFGDVTFEECEISWINPGDLSALLPAFPKLEEFRVRGGNKLTFGSISHKNLRTFAVESGGLPRAVIEEVLKAKLPALRHLELWLGSDEYGGIDTPEVLEPLLKGKLFRKLRYLGLCNCAIADAVATAVAKAPVVERLEVLDLSKGSLTDVGAEALLASPAVHKLKKLDLHHHFISKAFVAQLRKLPIEVDVSEPQEPRFLDYWGGLHAYRYIVAAE